jgi:hypothetical protein
MTIVERAVEFEEDDWHGVGSMQIGRDLQVPASYSVLKQISQG